jgi:cytochrome c peroxidase
MTERGRLLSTVTVLGLLLGAGCVPAGRYGTAPAQTGGNGFKLNIPERTQGEPKNTPPEPVQTPADYIWMAPDEKQMERPVPIVFVTEHGSPFEWGQLKKFWNYEAPAKAPAAPKPGAAPAKDAKPPADTKPAAVGVVKIKVPRGLPDPMQWIPGSNLPTVGKWELGKRLFFDDSYLAEFPRQSCAGCHKPDKGFSEGITFKTPRPLPLVNVVYNRYLFWDGRARALEEIIQRQPADELPPPSTKFLPPFQHTWSGVIARLRARADYRDQFLKVFGTPPTQDAVGKAIATYLATILDGDSVYDAAEAALAKRKGKNLGAADFAEVLKDAKDAAIKALDGEPAKKDDLYKQLATGARLFHDTGCIACHHGGVFHDDNFHNLGIGDSAATATTGQGTGRFAALPIGEKDPHLIGAYKTPMLRALPQTGPYFHDASQDDLFQVVVLHVRVGPQQIEKNPNLDPLLRDEKDPNKGRDLHLKEDDVRALVAFLKALDGPIDAVVRERDNWPEGTKPPPR